MNFTLCNWSWREAGTDDKEWHQCKHNEPTTEIFPDLLDAGVIPDPFVGLNEKKVQWVGERDWEYRATFNWDTELSKKLAHTVMRFEGLDTYATVKLNGQSILESSNMFHIHEIDVAPYVCHGENSVVILFESALRRAKEEESKHSKNFLFNGDSSRLYARKAQYHFGWDWGPVLLTCGPYKPISICSYDSKIHDIHVTSHVDEGLGADINIAITVSSTDETLVKVVVLDPAGNQVYADKLSVPGSSDREQIKINLHYNSPHLWYPMGYGEAARYTAIASLESNNSEPLRAKFGLRRVELIEAPLVDEEGTSFYFKVNNIPIFMNGTNWIPAHSYLTKLTRQDYREWVHLAARGNQNMLRVWGGGVFEHDSFYDACDEFGVVVWQDFLFGCGQYPYYEAFAQSVKRECEDQLRRLQNFCSIIIYAGNNEDYQVAEQYGLEWDKDDHSGHYEQTSFPARTFYETLLPNTLEEIIPGVIYHRGSPYGGKNTADLTGGDVHQWTLWHGSQERYQDCPKLAGRFVSEFGMLSLPCRSTLETSIERPSDLHPQSEVIEFHTKADLFVRRLSLYVMENIRVKSFDNIDDWIYATQLMQSECMSFAYKCWRRNWKGEGREYTAGALAWQLNDCWPGSSWAVCDNHKNPKLAYYAIKRESEPVTIAFHRQEKSSVPSSGQQVPWLQDVVHTYDLWGVNASLQEELIDIEIRTFDSTTGTLASSEMITSVTLGTNKSTDILTSIPVIQTEIIQAIAFDKKGDIVARACDWPQPLKYLEPSDGEVDLMVFQDCVKLSVQRPVKGLVLYNETNEKLFFEDNGLDLFPGDEYTVHCKGLSAGDRITYRYY